MIRKFAFKNFKPAPHLEVYANLMLEQISDPFPEGHIVSASMIKLRDEYFCFVAFQIGPTEYLADSQSLDPRVAIDRLDENLSRQLVCEQVEHFGQQVDTWLRTGLGKGF